MRYLGIDVHVKTSVWCLLDARGTVVERGKVDTTAPCMTALVERLAAQEELLAGQEVGKLSYFVHDVFVAVGVKVLSFNLDFARPRHMGAESSTISRALWGSTHWMSSSMG